MIELYLPSQVQGMDRRAYARGVDPAALMDHASRHLVRGILQLAALHDLPVYGLRVALVCGKGNNGGDGIAAGRHLLARGAAPVVALVGVAATQDRAPGAALGPDGTRELAAYTRLGGRVASSVEAALAGADIVVDCLLGTGSSGEPRGDYAAAVAAINASGRPVVACDLPTGVDGDTGRVAGEAVRSDLTVTLGAHKRGLWLSPATGLAGHVVLGEIGVIDGEDEPVARVLQGPDLRELAPPPDATSHKRSRGMVVIYAGSGRMSGAAVLSARGAMGGGAGLVRVAVPEAAIDRITGAIPEALTVGLPDDADGIVEAMREALDRADVLAIGPGLGLADATQQAVRRLVAEVDLPIVLDADGLNAFRDRTGDLGQRKSSASLVLTPHSQELARLVGGEREDVEDRRAEVAAALATSVDATVVAKGPRTVIAAPDGRLWINPTGGPALAHGGTGDVLTGVTAALLAHHDNPESVAAAVYVHGLAGELAGRARSARAATAGDVADHLADAALELGI